MPGTNISELSITREQLKKPHHKGNIAVVVVVALCVIPLLLVAFKFRDRFLPAPAIEVSQVIAIESSGDTTSSPKGSVQFQAPGWIEPAPFVTKATAQINGVVKSVHVIEGAAVKKGQLLVTLVDDDLQIKKKRLIAMKNQGQARIAKAQAALSIAENRRTHLASRVKSAAAKLAELTYDYEVIKSIEKITSRREVEKARLAMESQQVKVDEIKNEGPILDAEVTSRKADVQIAKGELEEVITQLDLVDLDLSRTKIHAPIDGVIMHFKSYVGAKHSISGDNRHSATIAELYQPDQLQVRVDVPLEDANGLSVGQKTRIKLSILPDTVFNGAVTSLAGAADIQRNTLEAKVTINSPSPILRPDMLARVEFLSQGSGTGSSTADGNNSVTLFVDQKVLLEASTNGASVWVVDPLSKTLEKRSITLGTSRNDGWVAVTKGVRAGEALVANPSASLKPGQRVEVQ